MRPVSNTKNNKHENMVNTFYFSIKKYALPTPRSMVIKKNFPNINFTVVFYVIICDK